MADAENDAVVRLLKRGLNHYGLGDLEAAIASWEEARQLDPDNHAVRDYLETAYEEAGRPPTGGEGPALASEGIRPVGEEDDTPRSEPDLESATPPERKSTSAGPKSGAGPKSQGKRARTSPAAEAEGSFENQFASLFEPDGSEDAEAPDTLLQGALEAYRAGQLEDAWLELDQAAQKAPDRLDLRAYRELIRNRLMDQWARAIGDQGRSLQLKLGMDELLLRDLQPDEGFLVSQIDGMLTIENLLSLSSLDRFRTLEILARLIRDGIVE
jgi:tetratricopeptide (TPR) repeat protein